jgi:hypothetical protein
MPLMLQEMLIEQIKTEDKHRPERYAWEKIKHAEEIKAVEKTRGNWDRVPARMCKVPGVSHGAVDGSEFGGGQWHSDQQMILFWLRCGQRIRL